MSERDTRNLGILKKIYDGDIMYCDKPTVNKDIDKLFNEINELHYQNNNKTVQQIIDKYTELISLLEIESFAKGVAFMEELMTDIKKVCL